MLLQEATAGRCDGGGSGDEGGSEGGLGDMASSGNAGGEKAGDVGGRLGGGKGEELEAGGGGHMGHPAHTSDFHEHLMLHERLSLWHHPLHFACGVDKLHGVHAEHIADAHAHFVAHLLVWRWHHDRQRLAPRALTACVSSAETSVGMRDAAPCTDMLISGGVGCTTVWVAANIAVSTEDAMRKALSALSELLLTSSSRFASIRSSQLFWMHA